MLEYTEPPADLISQAQKILSLIPFPLLYARVDGVEIDNILVLMEVELIEPSLFLNHSSKAVNNFINTIIAEIVF